ncbi:hypothetical protein niasHT_011048 [Heterodera trifolii]|uniref:Elongator complex protein 4 n=1 Tax=Heterodera trifolii TaxID=157864 RepID=A0ABD2L9L9_9BILA
MFGHPKVPNESTGTEAIDALIGGGVSIANAMILLDEKGTDGYFCRPIQRCFVAEGLDGGQKLFLASPMIMKMRKLLEKVPSKSTKGGQPTDGDEGTAESDERLKIAWRYQTKPTHESTIGGGPLKNGEQNGDKGATKFDLSRVDDHLDIDRLIALGRVIVFECDQQQPSLANLWSKIHRQFAESNGTFLRLLITDLSSPLWADLHLLELFCAHLKAFCRRCNCSALLSFDSSLLPTEKRQNILPFVDAAFQMERMDERQQKMLCLRRRIDGGRFCIVKLPAFRSAAPSVLPVSSDFLFSLTKRSFEIKLLHLPPALGEEKETKHQTNCCKTITDQF